MKRIRWVAIPMLFILACLMLPLASTGPVQADERKTNLAELTAGADSVIVGTVVELSSYWNDEHTGIYTSAVLSIEEELKGTASQDRITVTLPGGEADGIGQWVSDVPSFDQGEKAVVFLKKIPPEKLPKTKAHKAQPPEEQFEVYRGYQGKFAIKQGKVDNLPEPEFKERVRKVAQGQTLPEAELYVPSSTATFPYSYAGFCWPHPPAPVVSYRINENTADCGGEGATVQTAAATWNAPANFSLSYAGASAATAYSYNGVNEALWKDFGSGGTIAHAIIWYSGSTILENDIEFNDYYVWSTAASCPGGQFDVETIALHELGHWLCLNDLYNAADAAKVMYGYGSTGTTKRALHADDIAGIQFIYGVSALNITTTSLPDGTMGSPYSQTLQATGGTGSYTWSITGGSLPAGLTLTPSSGLISGTPTASGPSSFTVQVNDGSTTATKSLSINISSPTLTITTSSLPAGVVDTPYSQQLQATGGTGSYTWSIISGSLPVGLSLTQSSGLISGTPTIAATSNFTVQVNDNSTTASKSLSITVNPAGTTQKLVGTDTSGTEPATLNYIQLSKFTASATGTISQIKVYSIASANVKVAIYADNNGEPGALLNTNNDNNPVSPNQWSAIPIANTSVTSGTAYWLGAIMDTNSVTRVISPNPRRYKAQAYAGFSWPGSLTGLTTADNVFLCIAGWSTTGPAPLAITTTALPDGTVDVPYSQTLQATGGTGSYTWSITGGSLPAGLTLTPSSGLISGTPTIAATSNFTVQVNDGSTTATKSLSITINSPPPLNITTASLPDGNVGSAYSQTLQATGGTDSYNWSITSGSLPAGLSLTQSSGLISGTPTAAATSNFTVQVNDGSTTASKPLSITVNPADTTQKLVGTDTSGTETVSPNYIQLSKFTAAATGTVSQIKVYSTASAHVKVAIYADNAGAPGALLNANNDNNLVSPNQWNNISITSTPVTSGTAYWLGAITDTNSVTRVTTPNPRRYKAQAYAGFSWPGSLTGLTTADNVFLCIACWGVVSPPTLPDPPSLLSPGATITFKWGTSTGATTYWLQVNTASDFTGTNMFNSEVGNITSQEVAGLSLGTAYYWRVKAGNSSGWSNWSSVRSVLANTVP